ncbi:unnamed protein product [Thelazia callipaeda]|uniref:Uncharacterized protein n=1 Tax=Thelazia callipaeda TaxID=103827 RepID=A0A0N5CS80_THECL|nr:unnamed protein product [Thelazia callipaeda]
MSTGSGGLLNRFRVSSVAYGSDRKKQRSNRLVEDYRSDPQRNEQQEFELQIQPQVSNNAPATISLTTPGNQ